MKKLALYGLLIILALALAGCASNAVRFEASSKYKDRTIFLNADMLMPQGKGPHPAVVLLHGCSGIMENHWQWAEKFKEWGYVVLVLDSMGPRGYGSLCGTRGVSIRVRAQDAYDAKNYLEGLPFVRKSRIAVVGWSHGGSTVLMADNRDLPLYVNPFQAYVALYPGCFPRLDRGIYGPLLILSGDKDDWTPASKCRQMRERMEPRARQDVELIVIPGAYHSWDHQKAPRNYMGHHLEYSQAATDQSRQAVRDFLERHLR